MNVRRRSLLRGNRDRDYERSRGHGRCGHQHPAAPKRTALKSSELGELRATLGASREVQLDLLALLTGQVTIDVARNRFGRQVRHDVVSKISHLFHRY